MKINELKRLDGFYGFGRPRPYCIGDNVYKLVSLQNGVYKAIPYTWHDNKFVPAQAKTFLVSEEREIFEVE